MAQLELGPNIARNAALTENVFMMVVCIELRIPLFVVGKPGSSKSLAKTVVADNMQGETSKSELFKTFKQVRFKLQFTLPVKEVELYVPPEIRGPLTSVGIPNVLLFKCCANLRTARLPCGPYFVEILLSLQFTKISTTSH